MNIQQVNQLIGTVQNLINNCKKFTLCVNPTINGSVSKITNQTLGYLTNYEIDSISLYLNQELKITCFINDSSDNTQETIFHYNLEKVFVSLHIWEEFGSYGE